MWRRWVVLLIVVSIVALMAYVAFGWRGWFALAGWVTGMAIIGLVLLFQRRQRS